MAAITYTSQKPIGGPTFSCPRCRRVYPFPNDTEKPIRCECGWWYRNLGGGHIVDEFHPRIGGAGKNG
jgi:hypothetical protein